MMALTWIVLSLTLNSTESACQNTSVPVVVDTRSRQLFLCQQGKPDRVYRVNLGQGGLGKTKEGDRKTPLGIYSLQPPRKSNSGFTWFVPIGYPTPEQKKKGYTGSSIGIHGPPDWMPSVVVKVAFQKPWTDGCIMVETIEDIEAIRRWILKNNASQILIV